MNWSLGGGRRVVDGVGPGGEELVSRAAQLFRGVGESSAFVQMEGAVAVVATEGDAILGWCWGYVLPRPDGFAMAYVHDLEVAELYRGQGVGRKLIVAFADLVARRGAATMFLTTGVANAPARGLYDSLGGALAEQGPTVNYWFRLPVAET